MMGTQRNAKGFRGILRGVEMCKGVQKYAGGTEMCWWEWSCAEEYKDVWEIGMFSGASKMC